MSDQEEESSSSEPGSSSSDQDDAHTSPHSSSNESSTSRPSPRARRSTGLLRRRDQQQRRQTARGSKSHHHQRGSAAMRPSDSTSLWRIREKQFEKFRAGIIVLPVPPTAVRVDKAKGYSLHIMSVANWVLPDAILRSWSLPVSRGHGETGESEDEDEELLVTLGVHVSLFHSLSKRFFGNTWVSSEIAVDPFQIKQDRHTKDNTIRHVVENVVLNLRAYFITDVVDTNCVGIVELVAYEKDPDSKATISVVGCGWTILPLFTSSQSAAAQSGGQSKEAPQQAFAIGASGESVNVFTGSPRVLWEIPSTQWHAQEKQERCKFYYQLVLYEPLLAIAMFIRKNEFVSALETIPGLKNGNLANIDVGKNPKMLLREDEDTTFEEALATFVKLASLVPKTILLEEDFTINVFAIRAAIHLREEVEANLVARLKISRKTIHEGALSIEGEVSARVVKLALHNGRCFRTRLHTIPLKVEQQGSDHLRCVTNQTKLKGFVLHPHFAIVVILQFTVHFRITWPPKMKQQAIDAKKPLPPEEDVVLVTMGTRALVPSDGKKLYLYDKQHHATAEASDSLVMADTAQALRGHDSVFQDEEQKRRILHVELLSGAPCRPYSDNPLYTPPNQGGKPLQKQGLALNDSIAFVDLRIMIDGEGALSPKRLPSPAKSLHRSNNNGFSGSSDDHDSDNQESSSKVHAAGHWAAKMLNKADKNSVLAQTLNALATSVSRNQATSPHRQTESNQQPMSPPVSPSKKKQTRSATTDPIPLPTPVQASELSRASKTLLTRYGFMDAHDTSATNHQSLSSPSRNQLSNNTQGIRRTMHSVKSLEVELSDVYKAHEIRFHFAAYRSVLSAVPSVPSRVYFTFQFYNFAPTRTETLRLSKAFDNGAGGESQTFLLMRESPVSKPSLAIQFDIDTTATLDPLETRGFAEYLLRRSLYVDVWDAESLFQIGTFAIPLHELLRQGSGIKKFQAEVDIVQPIDSRDSTAEDDEFSCTDMESLSYSAGKNVVGKVQFLMSNYGLKGQHALSGPLVSAAPQVAANPSSGDGANATHVRVKHRVRARPLVDSNAELLRLLSQEGFYGADKGKLRRRREGEDEKLRREHRKQQKRGLSDATSLSPKEIAILCDLFGSKPATQSSSQHRSTRIQCDRYGKTGLLALLSVNPQLQNQQQSDAPRSVIDKPALESKGTVPDQQPPSALHIDRLKRVFSIVKAHEVGLQDAFELFDSDKDGFLSREEFMQALKSMGTVFSDLSDDDLLAIAAAMDSNNDEKIEFKEFGAFLSSATQDPKVKSIAQWRDEVKRILVRAMEKGIPIHKIFAEFDASGDGNLSYDEFGRALQKLGVPQEQEKNRESLMAEFDKNKDGQISYEEFLQSFGISVEINKVEIVKETVQDIEVTVRETLKRMETQGIELAQVFTHFDKNQNRKLSVSEFTQALQQLLQLNNATVDTSGSTATASSNSISIKALEQEAVHAFVKKINANGDDEIDYCEFLAVCGVSGKALQQQTQMHQDASRVQAEKKLIQLLVRALQAGMSIEQIFQQFDANADRKITISEFQRALDELFRGQGLTKEDTAMIASKFDADGDREVSFQEFQSFGHEIQRNQQALMGFFSPHTAKLAEVEKQSSKLALGKWQQLCSKDLKLTKQQMDAIKPLLPYFELVDETKKVDLTLLCSLLKPPATAAGSDPSSSTPAAKKEDPVTRLRAFLLKAKAMGVNTDSMFAEFDVDGDGEVTREEFKSILKKLGRFDDVSDQDLDAMLAEVDADGSGKISMQEFKVLIGEKSEERASSGALMKKFSELLTEAINQDFDVEKCFEHFDKDSGGNITKSEFLVGMKQLGLGADDATLDDVFAKLDRDGSGEISMTEFKQLFPGPIGSSGQAAEQPSSAKQNAKATPRQTARLKSFVRRASTSKSSVQSEKPIENPVDPPAAAVSQKDRQKQPSTKDRLRALLQQAEQSGHDVGACFSHFDNDGDGKITAAEFVQGMKALAGFEDVTESELLALVGELDSDASNSVSLDEFKAFMKTDATVSSEKNKSEEPLGKVEKPVDADTTVAVVVSDTKPAAEQSEGGQEAARADSESKVQEKPVSDGSVEKQETEQSAGSSSVKQVENVETDEPIIPSSDATEGTIITTEPEPKAAQSAAAVERKPPTVRSSSFAAAKGKPPSFASRRAKTESAIGIDEKAPVAAADAESQPDDSTATRKPGKAPVQRAPSFAAARAAKAAATRSNAVAFSSFATPVTSPVLIGLDKLRTLLLSAAQQGVDIQVSFDHFDEDKNGQLTYDEFVRGIRKLGSEFQQLTDEEIIGMAKELDQKQQSAINIQDLVQLVSGPSPVDDQAALSSIPDPSNAPATVQPTDAAVGKDPGSTDAVTATPIADAVAVPKRALVSARVASDSTSHAPVRRTSSLKPAPSRLSSAAATKGGNATEVAAAQAPVMRTSSLKSAPKKIAPTDDAENTAVVVPMTSVSARTSEVMEKLSDRRKTPSAAPTQGETRSPDAAVSMDSDCAYTFHQDPQIRSVELKLRKAAVDAYSRGILPLRVITKFLDQDDGRPSLSSSRGSARARKKRDELLRVEFLQVLMELGFSLLSDQDEDTNFAVQGNEGAAILRGAPHPTTRMNDHLYARQLERLSRYKHHIKEETKAQKQLVRAVTKTKQAQQQQSRLAKNQQLAAEDSLRRFADEKNQLLRVLSYYRDGQKKSLVYSLIRDQVTTTVTLMPYFGALLFFELPFQNPYNHHERFRMEMVLPQGALEAVLLDIDIVKSGAEWEFYRENLPLAYGSSSEDDGRAQQAVEKEMIDDHNEVVMDGHDRIQIPVRLRWLDANLKTHSRRLKTSNGQDEKAIVAVSMVIRSCTHGHTVALFKLQIHPQPLICHRVLRFSHPSGSIWRWRLRCPRGKYLVCMDSSVAVDDADSAAADDDGAGDRMVVFKCRVGEYPSLEEFYIVLYDDKYYAKIYEVWQVRIQAKLRLDIHAVMGQSVKNELIIRGGGSSSGGNGRGGGGDVKRHVKCFTTFEHMDHIQFRPSHVFQLVSNAFNRIEFAFCTTQQLQGSGGGYRVLVNLVDVETQELVGAWIIHVSLSLPLITKTYELRLPLNQAVQKKILYANPWDQQQTILLRSSFPALIKPRDAVLQIPGNGKVFLRLSFMPVERKAREHMYLFINDRHTDQNEECLLFQVTYE